MFKNYFKIAWRNLWNKVFSAINILGLSAGLACCILIFLFIQYELSYDKFNVHARDVYRTTSVMQSAGGESELAVTAAPCAPLMKKDFPEIKEYTKLLKDEKVLIGQPDQQHFYETHMLYANSTFFDVFSIALELEAHNMRCKAKQHYTYQRSSKKILWQCKSDWKNA